MGYNGRNRKGYDRRYRGLSKSSMRSSNSILFGKKGIVTGLFDIGDSVVKDLSDTTHQSDTSIKREPSVNSNFSIGVILLIITSIVLLILIVIYVPWLLFIIGLLLFGAALR